MKDLDKKEPINETLNTELFLLKCPNYDSYLDTFVKPIDRQYMRNDVANRKLVQLGYRTAGASLYTQRQFTKMKQQILESLYPRKRASVLFSFGVKTFDPVLKALIQRELPNVQKAISTIIFVKRRKRNGFDVSGFIDFEHSLHHSNVGEEGYPDWHGVFNGSVPLVPHTNDLSYYDWHSGTISYNNSDNYIISHDRDHGLLFLHRGDHKKICVDHTNKLFNMNSQYSMVHSSDYGEISFFDHIIHKKI